MLSVRERREVVLPGSSVALPELCSMKRLWGLDCPGCGMTRAFISLGHGDVRAAWAYNPAAIWLFAIMAFQVPWRAVQLIRVYGGRDEWSLGFVTHVALVGLAVWMMGQWMIRVLG